MSNFLGLMFIAMAVSSLFLKSDPATTWGVYGQRTNPVAEGGD